MKSKILMKMNVKLGLCLGLLTPMFVSANAYDNEDSKKLVVITLKGAPVSSKVLDLKPTERVSAMITEFRLRAASLLKDLNKEKASGGASDVEPLYSSNSVIARLSKASLKRIVSNPGVQSYTYDRQLELWPELEAQADNDKRARWTYGLKKSGIPGVRQAYGLDGSGVRVGVLDSGIDPTHPHLEGQVVAWKDFAGDRTEPADLNGHGTHCAGTIAGIGDYYEQIGVAPGANLVVGRIFSDSNQATYAGILRAMEWMTDPDGNPQTADHPRIVSNSWGGARRPFDEERALWNAVQTWRDMGIMPVFAIGNSGPNSSTAASPGAYPHAFGVGATDHLDRSPGWSSRGPVRWQGKTYIKPDISAPGLNVLSAKPGGKLVYKSGTSMAAPHIAGMAALLLQSNPNYTVDQLETILLEGVEDLGKTGKDNVFGEGRANVKTSLDGQRPGGVDKLNNVKDKMKSLY